MHKGGYLRILVDFCGFSVYGSGQNLLEDAMWGWMLMEIGNRSSCPIGNFRELRRGPGGLKIVSQVVWLGAIVSFFCRVALCCSAEVLRRELSHRHVHLGASGFPEWRPASACGSAADGNKMQADHMRHFDTVCILQLPYRQHRTQRMFSSRLRRYDYVGDSLLRSMLCLRCAPHLDPQ